VIGANAPGMAYFGQAYDAPRVIELFVGGALGLAGAAAVGRLRRLDQAHGGVHAGAAVIMGPSAAVVTTGKVRVG